MEIGVTVYSPSEEGKPQLEWQICSHANNGSAGYVGQSKLFELQQGEELVIRLYKGPVK